MTELFAGRLPDVSRARDRQDDVLRLLWSIQIEVAERGVDGGEFVGPVRVPRPAHFAIQKALIFTKRNQQDQVKDLTYVFDLIDAPNALAERLREEAREANQTRYAKDVRRFVEVLHREFNSDRFLKLVSEQFPPEQRPAPAYIQGEVLNWLASLDLHLP